MSHIERINYPLVNEVRIAGTGIGVEKTIEEPNKISLIISLVKLIKKRGRKDLCFVDTPDLARYRIDLLNKDKQAVIGSVPIVGCGNYWSAFWNDKWHVIPLAKGPLKELAKKVIKAIK